MTSKPSHKSEMIIHSYKDEELSNEMKLKVEKLMKFFDQYEIDYDKFNLENTPKLDLRKAYPNVDQYMHVPGQHNTDKWLQAISDIYRKEKRGEQRVHAIRSVVNGWDVMETFDFLNWVKFYESGGHMKYKFAQLWYENDNLGPGYFLQVKKDPDPVLEQRVTGTDVDQARTNAVEDVDRRSAIERQRNKIIGRLDSAEKLLRTQEGHIFSGKEFESLLNSIYDLKKKIQMVNKISQSTRLYEDMIVREANILSKKGFVKASNMLFSVAQTPGVAGEQAHGSSTGSTMIPSPAPPEDPGGAGNPGVPSGGAATPAQPPGNSNTPQSPQNESPQPEGISKFLSRMDEGTYAPDDESNVEDNLNVEDTLEVSDNEEELMVTEAQVKPEEIGDNTPPAPLNPSKVLPSKNTLKTNNKLNDSSVEEPLEVTEDDIKSTPKTEGPSIREFDAKVDAVFSNITIEDVVAKLEDLAKIYKTREVPRQLGIVDMMLDSLGLASYFPSLSEATNKALESNNYISTRIEDILSKLRGSMRTNKINLSGGPEVDRPDVSGVRSKLKDNEEKEKLRKQQRKEQENADLDNSGKETPEVEIDEDLATKAPQSVQAPKAPHTVV